MALVALSAIGVAIAAYLSWIAIIGVDSIACGPAGDCHAVQTSEYSKVAGVPVAMLGLAMYLALLGGAVARQLLSASPPALSPLARRVAVWTFALAFGGTLYSGYLTYVELFVIDAICAWCVASAVVVTAIFVLTLPDVRPVAEASALGGPPGGRSPASDV
jgi:uncharacterized membrane protein